MCQYYCWCGVWCVGLVGGGSWYNNIAGGGESDHNTHRDEPRTDRLAERVSYQNQMQCVWLKEMLKRYVG